jgi:hypothetical protein
MPERNKEKSNARSDPIPGVGSPGKTIFYAIAEPMALVKLVLALIAARES